MDCRHAISQIAALSADDLPAPVIAELRAHLAECLGCRQEWQLFQSTLLVVSTVSQRVPTTEQTERMWQACFQEVHIRIEQQRLKERRAEQRPRMWNWLMLQPRWGWVALGGAVTVLGAVWFLPPQDVQAPDRPPRTEITRVSFEMPPDGTSPLVNHHVATMFDPFTDHVASTLVSYSATAPQPRKQP
ncbi:MAG TPA: hypothetical protein VNA16_05210 [Abditibacteriaceae bacterium]|nr:hypothetical protein [Abditibacteriaceae bacterium]